MSTPPLLPEPPRQLSVTDIEEIIDRRLRAWSKQSDVIGKVSALDPLTVKLRSGDVPIARRAPGVVVAIGDQVYAPHDGAGHVLVGVIQDTEDAPVPMAGLAPIGAVMGWPVAQPIPAGWAEATDLAGRFLVHPNGTTFIAGTTGGTSTHNHGGDTGNQSAMAAGVLQDGSQRTGVHTHSISSSNHLPPWTATHIWIRRVA